MRAAKIFLLILLFLWTLLLNIYHAGVLKRPKVPADSHGEGQFISREEMGLNHLIISGTPFGRGQRGGELTKHLLFEQEESLINQLEQWIPRRGMMRLMAAGLVPWFFDIHKYVDPDDLLEMYGTSLSAPKEFDFLADGFTRQLAYHGLHEVGQMMVDRGFEDMGCTVAAVRHGSSWVLGRNFDFEGGRIFDREKLVKWTFPDRGLAHVSVIWSGMVGGVTGVNEKGVFISMNSAGSDNFKRVGTPSTLVLVQALKQASTAEEAAKLLSEAEMFITDIFVVMDSKGTLLRVEKSPTVTEILPAQDHFVVTNHLLGPAFTNDKNNETRKRELTTLAREARGLELVQKIPARDSLKNKKLKILEVLRDKGVDANNKPLALGNRSAIDALIATHSVIYDGETLYVSQGPALTGALIGYDLKKSFQQRTPVQIDILPADPTISEKTFSHFKESVRQIGYARKKISERQCETAIKILSAFEENFTAQSLYHHALGDAYNCVKDSIRAREHWQMALNLHPAYLSERKELEKKLE